MFTIKVLTTVAHPDYRKPWSEDNRWRGAYLSFPESGPYVTVEEAHTKVASLKRKTGKCYAIYGPDYVYHTTAYYKKCPEGQ